MNVTLLVSTCSFFATLTAVVIGVRTYQRKYTENLLFTIEPSFKPYQIGWMANKERMGKRLFLITEWECMIVNNGELNVSIIGIQAGKNDDVLMEADTIYAIKTATAKDYSHEIINIHKNVYFLQPDEQIHLPLKIAAGEGLRFKIKIGLPIGDEVQEKIQEQLNNKRLENDTHEIFRFLNEQKLTLSGKNEIQVFQIGVGTARNRAFITEASLYRIKKPQGSG